MALLIIATASYYVIERPFLRLKPRFQRTPPAKPQVGPASLVVSEAASNWLENPG